MAVDYRLIRIGELDLISTRLGPDGGARMIVTTRRGGTSYGREDLNLSYGPDDERENITANRQKLFSALGIEASNLLGLQQIHSAKIIEVTGETREALLRRELKGDGLMTRERGLWLGVSIGDCQPVAIYDPRDGALALLHAGWGGTAKRIVAASIERMVTEYGCDPADLWAVLGPCVRAGAYQVDEPVFAEFDRHWDDWKEFLYDSGDGRGYIDLAAANRHLLESAGVPPEQINEIRLCTNSLSSMFFSHRRDGTPSGRMLSLACIDL